jgi:lysozyme
MRTFGVDVSHWEGIIDWKLAAPFIPFAYFKCTDGLTMFDNTFAANHLGCQANGVPHAPYHYFQPYIDPILQANHFIDKAGLDFKRYIFDVEEQFERTTRYDFPAQLHLFLTRVKTLTGISPAIYTSAGFWNEFIHPKPEWAHEYDLLVAHYTIDHQPTLPIGWSTFRIWQFTDAWYFPGCNSAADGDWFNGDLVACRAWFGNYRQVAPPVYEPVILRSQFEGLHIRQFPKISAREVGHLNKDEVIELEELGGQDVWVKHARGWTAVERYGYRYMEVLK